MTNIHKQMKKKERKREKKLSKKKIIIWSSSTTHDTEKKGYRGLGKLARKGRKVSLLRNVTLFNWDTCVKIFAI